MTTAPAQTRPSPILISALLALTLLPCPAYAQQAPGSAPFGLEDGTPVRLRLQRTISSADAQVNDRVDFEVLQEVKVGGVVVIPKGALALGTVTEAQPKRRLGRGGKLNVVIDSVRLKDGEKAALRAVKDVKGGGPTGKMTGGIVATSIVFFPAAPFFLFMHGKDITIPKGTEITAYVNGDMPLNRAAFAGASAGGAVAAASGRGQPAAAGLAPPTLIMVDPSVTATGERVHVAASPLTIRGVVMNGSGLPTVSINGVLASLLPKSAQAAEFWSAPIALKPGDNRFEVVAVNAAKAQARFEFVAEFNPSGGAPAQAAAPRAPNPRALSLEDITGLLTSHVASARVVELVGQFGLKFVPTEADLAEIRKAGGDEALIETIRRAAPARP